MIGLVNLWLILPIIILSILIYKLSQIYFGTARNIKRLESTSKMCKSTSFLHSIKKDFQNSTKSGFYSYFFIAKWPNYYKSSPMWDCLPERFQSVPERSQFCILPIHRNCTLVWNSNECCHHFIRCVCYLHLHNSARR